MLNTIITFHGSRGFPNRYGGFEELGELLARHAPKYNTLVVSLPATDQKATKQNFAARIAQCFSSTISTPFVTWAHRNTCVSEIALSIVVNPINVFTALSLSSSNCGCLLHMDGMEDQRRKWGFIAKRAHRLARHVAVRSSLRLVTDSRAIQEWYREKYGRETIFIPYGGCEIAEADAGHRWNPVGIVDFYMVLARPEPENQIFEICRAFLNSSSPFRLVVVGAPRAPTKYWKKVQRLVGDSPRVHLAGSIYDRDRRCEMYVNTRGVIHGHTVGGTNPSLVDALSHGCPVLPHGNPYNREVAGETGVYWNSEEELVAILNDTNRVYPRVDTDEFITRYNWNDVANAYFTALGLLPKEGLNQ